MKKKVLTVALIVALIAIVVSGSLAYFTAADQATNTFTVGSVRIEVWENGAPTDTDEVIFEKPLLPVVNTEDVTADEGYAAKVVKTENAGKSAAYIRTHIAVPTKLIGYLELKVNLENTNWAYIGTTEAAVDGVDYTVFTYDYLNAVEGGDFTEELLQGAYLKSEVDMKDDPATETADLVLCKPNGDGTYTFSGYVGYTAANGGYTANTLQILVASEAIQAQGFDGATAALNAGFGTGTNPWQ